MSNKQEIINQNFYDCYNFCEDDNFYKKIFLACSKGQFMKNFYYNPKKCEIKISLPNQKEIVFHFTENVEQNTTKLIDIFANVLHLGDTVENEKQRNKKNKPQVDKITEELKSSDWKKIKNSEVKRMIISNYAKSFILKYPDLEENTVTLKFMEFLNTSQIKSNDIEICEGVIKNIPCIVFDEKTKTFSIQRKTKK